MVDEALTERFTTTVREMMENVREMIAAAQLLRSRIESQDEVLRVLQNRVGRIEEYQNELDRRLTKMENEYPRHRHHAGTFETTPPITIRNRSGDT